MKLSGILLLLILTVSSLSAKEELEYDYELDAYYSNLSLFIELDAKKSDANISKQSEISIYSQLLLDVFHPNLVLVEAAIYPMPLFGLYFRKNSEDLYHVSKIEESNVVKLVTAGFEEPYSLSLFFGRMVEFETPGYSRGKNRAFSGYLLSIGDYSIKDNLAYYNRWVNFEVKLKGTKEQKERDLDWSFRVGYKINENRDFVDTLYIGARRSSIDYQKSVWSLRYNSAFSTLLEVRADTFFFTKAEFILEKKFPLRGSQKVAFGLGIGYLYDNGERYSSQLRERGIDNHQFIVRPNLKF